VAMGNLQTQHVVVTDCDGVAHIQLNRPSKLNAIDGPMMELLAHNIRDVVRSKPRAIVLSGAGRAFCAGGDIEFAKVMASDPVGYAETMEIMLRQCINAILDLRGAPCVTVSALEGVVVGGGIGFALSTDQRVMGVSCRLIPGWLRAGATPDAGGSYFLGRYLGSSAMASLVISGEEIDASRAHSLMLVQDIVDDGMATARAMEIANDLSELRPRSILAVRKLADELTSNSLAEHLHLEMELLTSLRRPEKSEHT
jgi:2-(1,2-epoxy-1,2-dihydrophenyl)acetyl-CoA isomerase